MSAWRQPVFLVVGLHVSSVSCTAHPKARCSQNLIPPGDEGVTGRGSLSQVSFHATLRYMGLGSSATVDTLPIDVLLELVSYTDVSSGS